MLLSAYSRSLLLILASASYSVALYCNVENSVSGSSQMVCPLNVNECLKFECLLQGRVVQYKGCNDMNNPSTACPTLVGNCMRQGGEGQCHACLGDYCNTSSQITSYLPMLPVAMWSILTR